MKAIAALMRSLHLWLAERHTDAAEWHMSRARYWRERGGEE